MLIIDEANVYKLFSKDNLPDTKLMLEGKGRSMNGKFKKLLTGFANCRTLLTCNFLPYPFTQPHNSSAGFDQAEWAVEKTALESRCKLFEMKISYDRDEGKFPFTEKELAHMMFFML